MTVSLKSRIDGWEGVGVVVRYDSLTGTWIFIALHNDTLGSCTGGTRMKVYSSGGMELAKRLFPLTATCLLAAIGQLSPATAQFLASADSMTGTWMFIALHNDTLGSCTGGTRMKVYPSPALALQDAMRLGECMTYKWAAVDISFGGGKAVLAVPHTLEGEERQGLLTRYGRLIESLNGTFSTGVDLGTTPDDMLVIGRVTSHVHGVDRETGGAVDPGPYTAQGVLAGMRAAVRAAYGNDDFRKKVVHIQGVGGVGAPLARLLKDCGADLRLSDLDSRRAEALAEELGGAETFEPHTAYEAQCDVYAPCAVGATLNEETIPQLKCRVVAGSANNQLAVPEDAERLHKRVPSPNGHARTRHRAPP